MMRQMRENTKWIMLVTALAFVALMVFEWGADVTGRSAGGLGEIGRVNGTPIYYEEFQTTYRNLFDRAQAQQEEPLTSQQNADIEDAAFDELVNRILVEQELRRRGIRVTDEEIRQAARFSPPPVIRTLPAFQADGAFDLQRYQQYLASPAADPTILLYIEEYFRDVIPRGKLLRQVSSGIFLTDQELWQLWKEENETVEILYIPLDPATRVSDEEIEVTDAEIRSYYDDNQEQFEVPAVASVKAVILGKSPTPADSATVRKRATEIAVELRETGAWEEIAAAESSDAATAQVGGDLGVFDRGQMVPRFDSTVFAAPVGRVLDPVETSFGVHVIEVQERWAQDSVRARHVLLPFERTDDSEIELLTLADSLEILGEDRSLSDAAATLGLEAIDAQVSGDLSFIPGAGPVGEGADWALLEALPGEVSPVFENQQAFYALELVESRPERVLTLEEAEPQIRQTLLFDKKMRLAVARGRDLVEQIRSGATLPEVATAAGLQIRSAGPFARNEFVPGIGRQNAAVGAAFGLEVGEVSDVVRTPTNAFIIESVAKTPADSALWETQKATQRLQVVSTIEQTRLQEWLEALRANADIVDRRAEVLQPVDEDDVPLGPFGF